MNATLFLMIYFQVFVFFNIFVNLHFHFFIFNMQLKEHFFNQIKFNSSNKLKQKAIIHRKKYN